MIVGILIGSLQRNGNVLYRGMQRRGHAFQFMHCACHDLCVLRLYGQP